MCIGYASAMLRPYHCLALGRVSPCLDNLIHPEYGAWKLEAKRLSSRSAISCFAPGSLIAERREIGKAGGHPNRRFALVGMLHVSEVTKWNE